MERWRNHLCLLISYHSLLLSRFIKCGRRALIVLGLIESVNLPFQISCDQSQSSLHGAALHPHLTSCLLESSLGLVLSLEQQILTSLQFNCNKMSGGAFARLATTAQESSCDFSFFKFRDLFMENVSIHHPLNHL